MPDTILSPNMLTISGNASGPKYRRVAESIQSAIKRGDLKPGEKLPPVRELAWSLGITPGTVARAYTVLTDGGHVIAEVGRGTFVAYPPRTDGPSITPRDYVTTPYTDGKVSLASPQLPDLGQTALIREAAANIGKDAPERLLHYPTRSAYKSLREATAHWLRDHRLGRLDEGDIVLVHGGQNGLCVTLQAILRGPRPGILIDDMAYSGFRRAADLLRAETIGLPSDENGILPDALDAAARKDNVQVLCTTPEVHNPTLLRTPLERRKEIVSICRSHDIQIVEDECYGRSDSDIPSYRILAPERGWHITSLSKILTPALRVGFAIAPPGRGAELRQIAEHGFFGIAQPLAEMLETILLDPRSQIIADAVRDRMADYVRIAVNALGRYDLTWHTDVPFLWLRLPQGWRASAFCRAADLRGIQIRSADEFALRDGRAPHAVRIAINAQIPFNAFEDAMNTLGDLLSHPPEQISV